MTLSSLQNGDIVLVTFPFTDLLGSKVRPAVIISSDQVNQKKEDYTLLFISSMISESLCPDELLFSSEHADFKKSGLKKTSLFKANKIATVQKSLLKRKLGSLGNTIRGELKKILEQAIQI